MIRLTEKLDGFYLPTPSLAYTLCLKSAFDGTPLEAEVWRGEASVISRYGSRLYVSAEDGFDEIKEFISIIGCEDIFTEKATALALDLTPTEEYHIFYLKKEFSSPSYAPSVGLNDLYSALAFGEDGDISLPDFEVFAPDASHRLRHGSAVGIVESFGGAYAIKSDKCAIIGGIAVNKAERRKGYGSVLLNSLLGHLSGDIFAITSDKSTEFYIKNGFTDIGKAVICRR